MPNPQDICEVTAGGTVYKWWKEVEVVRDLGQPTSQATLVVAEIGNFTKGWASLQLKPGDKATVKLAGQLAAKGDVVVRQVAYDGNNRHVRICVLSHVHQLVHSTVKVPPGQFKNQTLKQIANAVAAPVGVKFLLKGSPPGANKIFEMVSVHVGETPLQLITRLCYMRNIHLMDDLQGNLVGIRGPQNNVGELAEGRNILRAEMVWREDTLVKGIESTGENRGTDEHYSDDARANRARAENPYAKNNNTQEHVAPQPGDVKDFKMHADHMADLNTAEALTVNITVRGWLKSDGSLWMNHVGESVSVYSPMLFPQKSAQLWIQTVTHRQSDGAGTTTTISLTLNRLLKGGGGIEADGPGTSDDAKEQPPDS